jgi:ribonuclease HI
MGWVRKGKCNTKLKRSPGTKIIHDMIAAAEQWLSKNGIKNQIRKWETKEWGEIPADFGRK